jgi:hypothetical protein
MPRPVEGDYAPFYHHYIQLATGSELMLVMETSLEPLENFLQSIPPQKAGYAYAEGKWTMAQLLQHLIDTERVFAYRAMCIARGEQQPLPSFDENSYAANAPATNRSIASLLEEMILLRRSSILLLRNMQSVDLLRTGTASGKRITVNAIGFIMVGHVLHHVALIKERYL